MLQAGRIEFMRFVLRFGLMLIISFAVITFQNGVVYAQEDDFGIGIDDWPDDPLGDFGDEAHVEEAPDVKSPPKAVPEPAPAPVAAPVPAPVKSKVKAAPVETKIATPTATTPKATVADAPKTDDSKKTRKAAPLSSPAASSNTSGYSSQSSSSASTYTTTTSLPVLQPKGSIKRAGPPLILISRPVYAPYSTEEKTMYISAIAEAYFHFKLGALPGFQVISEEKIANNVQYFRDFTRRVSRSSYIEAARNLGASYLFYQEYEPQGKKVKFNMELYFITENKKITSSTQTFVIQEMEGGLFDCISEITAALAGTIPPDVQQILATDVLSTSNKAIETLGNQIVSVGDFSQKRAQTAVPGYVKIVNGNSSMHIARYITAAACARARQFDQAIDHQKRLISSFGSSYPALYLQLASYYRMAEKYNDALDAAEEVKREPSLKLPANVEIARIYEAKGDLNKAKSEYLSVLQEGGEDAEIYFQLALVYIGLNNLSQSSEYLSKAASAGKALDRGDYYDLGLRYAALGSANDQAIESFKNSLGIQQDNEDAWRQLADLYTKMRRDNDAADCYISLFHINNNAYKDYLPKAGMMFESLGMFDRAKDAYSLFLARKYTDVEVSLRLAKLELQGGNCQKAVELVEGMDTLQTVGSDVRKILDQCGQPERRVIVPTEMGNQKKWMPVFLWRVFSGVITAGAAGIRLLF